MESGEVTPRIRSDIAVNDAGTCTIQSFLKTVANETTTRVTNLIIVAYCMSGSFRQRVEAVVRDIPEGRVMTYGQIAALCGNARAARIVGGITMAMLRYRGTEL